MHLINKKKYFINKTKSSKNPSSTPFSHFLLHRLTRLNNFDLQIALLAFSLKVHLVVLTLVERKSIVWLALFRLKRSLAETLHWALGELWIEVGNV